MSEWKSTASPVRPYLNRNAAPPAAPYDTSLSAILSREAFAEAAVAAMRVLAEGVGGDPSVVSGEAGVGGLAGLLAATGDPKARRRLGLGPDASFMLFGSEGDTDPALYRRIVGRSGAEVRAA